MAVVDQLPYRPFLEPGQILDGAFRWRLGLRPLDLRNWFEVGEDGARWTAEKPGIMAAHPDQVFAALDDAEPECAEVAAAIADHVGRELDPSLHPLDAAARLVADDLVVMVERDDGLVFGAGSVCFPNRWDLPSKLGRTMAEVHAPVAGLNDQLESAVDGFLARLTPERSFWRLGWGLIDSAEGFEPPVPRTPGIEIGIPSGQARRRSVRADVASGTDAGDVHVRVERETLRRFPVTDCVLFTIRTYIAPIGCSSDDDRASIERVVAAMPPDVLRYKDLRTV